MVDLSIWSRSRGLTGFDGGQRRGYSGVAVAVVVGDRHRQSFPFRSESF